MATDIIFRSTPADRVIALLADGIVTEQNADDAKLFPIATRARDEKAGSPCPQDDHRPHDHPQGDEGPRRAPESRTRLPMSNLPASIRLSRRACARRFAPRSLPNQGSMERSMRIVSIPSRPSSPTIWS